MTGEEFAVQYWKKHPEGLATALGITGEISLEDLIAQGKHRRHELQTDLYGLCKALGYKDLSEKTLITTGKKSAHEEMCDFFIKKDINFPTFEAFAKQYSGLHDRLLLVPRGGFKSSIDIADCVQYIICWPEVTILILTGVYELACDFVRELRKHFTLRQDGKNYKPNSSFQTLFIEHCVTDKGAETEFVTPIRDDIYNHLGIKPDKEPTVKAASIEQNLSGWHFGIMKLDDVVTNENCLTPARISAINKQISINRAMLHPFGFFDKIGTWYDEADTYGRDIAAEELLVKEQGDAAKTINVLLRAALILTPEAIKAGKVLDRFVKKEDIILWFPERLSYEFLMNEWRRDPEYFPIKYLNDPKMVHQVKFPKELLLARTIPATMLPPSGFLVQTIDTAYSIKNWADYTVIITAIIYGGRFYIIDMTRGRFNEFDLPQVIASTGFKWKPKRIAIEDSMGVRWMTKEIRREMDKLGVSIPIEYVSLGLGTKAKAKDIKAKPVVRLLGDERMYFSKTCASLEDIYTELSKFGQVDSHDDIVSALSLLSEVFGPYADMEAKQTFIKSDVATDKQSKLIHDMVHGIGLFSKYNSKFYVDDNPVTAYELENKTTESVESDPLVDAGLLD